MNNPTLRKITAFFVDNLFYFVIIPLTGYLIYYAIATLQWRMFHDSTAFMYCAYLINELGFIPYRDIFEVQLPGTFFIYSIIGRLAGYSDLGFRIADLIYLAVVMAGTWMLLRKAGRYVALTAPIIFALLFFAAGPKMSLEREYLMLPFIIAGTLLAVNDGKLPYPLRLFIIGILFGLASLIKPHSLIGLPIILSYTLLIPGKLKRNAFAKYIPGLFSALAGVLIPWIITVIYLWSIGALASFLDIILNYWPLYGGLSGGNRRYVGIQILQFYLLSFRSFGTYGLWAIVAISNTVFCLRTFALDRERRNLILLFIALAVAYYIYPVISGQFFFYHWLPFLYFIIILASMGLLEPGEGVPSRYKIFPAVALAIATALSVTLPFGGLKNIYGDYKTEEPWGGRSDRIAEYIENELEPGDKVQPLGWIHGAEYALLMSRGELATRHLYDFDFYHHVSDPYIIQLRKDFIAALEEEKPRFIVEIPHNTLVRAFGPDTTDEFPELREFIDEYYVEVDTDEDYVIYERCDVSGK